MTVLEFFDKSSIDNLITTLSYHADKVIYIGYDEKQLKKECRLFEKIFSSRQMGVEIMPVCVPFGDDEKILQCFVDILQRERNLIVDLKGGDEVLLFLLGRAFDMVRPTHTQLHCIDPFSGEIQSHSTSYFLKAENPVLNVRETVELHGGIVADCTDVSALGLESGQANNALEDLQLMWKICCQNPNRWNSNANCLAVIDALGIRNGLEVTVSVKEAKRQNKIARYNEAVNILIPLHRAGLITMMDVSSSHILYVYKNRCVRECLRRAGFLLELKIFMTALECRNEDGSPVFQDAITGAVLDWDAASGKNMTVNETDVILMRGMIPYFISCKNGCVHEEELYKLATVARKFGGRHVQKIIVLQMLSGHKEKDMHFLNRAKEMGIQVIFDVYMMDELDLAEDLAHFDRRNTDDICI